MRKLLREIALSSIALFTIFSTTLIFHLTQPFYINFAMGEKYFNQGKYNTSLAFLLPAIKVKPLEPKTLQYIVIAYDKLKLPQESFKYMQTLEKTGIQDLSVRNWLADMYYKNSDFQKAGEIYRSILLSKNDPIVKRKLIETVTWMGNYDQAEVMLNQMQKNYPKDYNSMELLADIYSWNNKYDKSITFYRQVVSADSNNLNATLKLADSLRFSGNNKDAIKYYRSFIEKSQK
jgi:tetratricopeptide (TPR) repeat protein